MALSLEADIQELIKQIKALLSSGGFGGGNGGGAVAAMQDGKQILFNQTKIAEIATKRLKIEKEITDLSQKNDKYAKQLAGNLENVRKIENSISDANKRYAKVVNDINLTEVQRASKLLALNKLLDNKVILLEQEQKIVQKIQEAEEKRAETLKKQKQYIKDSVMGLFDMDKAVLKVSKGAVAIVKSFFDTDQILRDSAKSIGLAGSQFKTFFDNTSKAVANTAAIGGNFKDLAQFQSSYTQSIGKAVLLSTAQQEQVAYMAQGTVLGADGAAELASNFEMLGVNVSGTADVLEGLLNQSNKMGVSGAAATKKLQENVKLAQSYNFAGGVEGIKKMAAEAALLNINMQSIGQMSDKAFNVEGAVEMAAKLNVLGGSVSKYLGDWSTLLYDSREDIEDLAMRSSKAMGDYVIYDAKKQMYSITGIGKSILKQVSDATGQSYDELYKQATRSRQIGDIQAQMKVSMPPEIQEMISGKAQNVNGKWMISIGEKGELKNVSDLTAASINALKTENETLAQRAKDAAGFDTSWKGILETFKAELFPALEELMPFIKDVIHVATGIVKSIGAVFGKMPGWMTLGLAGLLGVATWAANGAMFGNIAGNIIAARMSTAAAVGGGGAAPVSALGKVGGFMGKNIGAIGGGLIGVGVGASQIASGNTGTGVGSMIGGVGGAILGNILLPGFGGVIGGALGTWAGGAIGGAISGENKISDGIVRSDGSVVKIDKADSVLAAKPGGVVDKMFSGGGSGSSVNGQIALSPLHITGEINLKYNGENMKEVKSALLLDDNFLNLLTSKINTSIRKSTNYGILQPSPLK